MIYVATAAGSVVTDGTPLTYLISTLGAGLLVLAGVATASKGIDKREESVAKASAVTGEP
jgi:hypothetical protein